MIGDQSFTCLAGKKVSKSAQVLDVLGDLDELSSILGLVKVFSEKKTLKKQVSDLQEDLILIGGWLSGLGQVVFLKEKELELEKKIAKIQLPTLKEFSRPGVNRTSAFLHLARVAVRKLERKVVGLKHKRYRSLIKYLNRLSTLLFWLAVKEEKK